ncbi:hypothetical protein AB0B94_30350 [Micromonospora sp. NPDC048986]|uniref:hypothetical protein n=1 Tax=Micromonospora sp. NPDC048986 TaxID=3155644 RepID=UPI00340FFDDC
MVDVAVKRMTARYQRALANPGPADEVPNTTLLQQHGAAEPSYWHEVVKDKLWLGLPIVFAGALILVFLAGAR